jgi:asparagine synthase (glutamine-hydrolysing)
MCGISGIVGLSEDKSAPLVQRMNDAMAHRGPDATHVFTTNEVSLGHRRLSIIDLSHGADQPFTDSSGRYSIVFNGEIYNYREIRAELRAEWRSESDTETILAAYMQWGKECLHKLRGMFAFAIWDAVEKSLFIARDRLGVKPFYYYKSNRVFAFASEIRALLSSNLCNAKIDKDGLYYYLKFGFVKSPRTILQNILQLNPGEYGIWKDGELTITTYWSLVKNTTETVKDTHQDIVKEVRELFRLSIKDRLVADVKVGAFLSGGIDSSGVVAMMSQLSDQAVETFSIVFNEKDFDESEYSKKIADLYQTKHTELLLKPEDILRNLPEFLNSIDTPGVDGINTFMVSKLVAATGIRLYCRVQAVMSCLQVTMVLPAGNLTDALLGF